VIRDSSYFSSSHDVTKLLCQFINIVNVMLIVLLRGFLNDLLYNGVRTSKARRC
jgi:hypothetical protein